MNNEIVDKNDALEVIDVASEAVVAEPENKPKMEVEKPSEKEVEMPAKKPAKFPTWTDFFATIGVFVLSVMVGSVLSVVLMKIKGEEMLTSDVTFVYYLVQMLPPIAFLLWRRHRAGRDSGIHFGLRRLNLPMILWGVVLVVASGIVIEPLLALFPTEAYEGVQQAIGLGGWAILSSVIAAPILEEVFFRGLVFESCRERMGRGGALLMSALLFGAIHIVPVQMINAFVVGLILGYVYLKTRSLLAAIIIHAVNNAIAYATMALFGDSANLTLRDVIPSAGAYWIIYGLSALLFLWAMVRLWRSLRDNTELE